MFNLLLSVVGFVPLIFGAKWLVDGASAIAHKKNISNLVIGLTIVAFGTSAPELVINVISAVEGNTGFSFGNVVGSNIVNILVILGISAMIYPVAVKSPTVWIEIPLCLLSAVVLIILANDTILDGSPQSIINHTDGLILLMFFLVFIYYSFFAMKKKDKETLVEVKEIGMGKSVFLVIIGMLLLTGGGQMIVYFAEKFGVDYGISDRIMGLTVLSLGTSLPELSTSVIAALKKNSDISIGNIIGSNIFNTFLILGLSSTIHPIPVSNAPGSLTSFVSATNLDMLVNLFATILVFVFVFTRKGRKIDRLEGAFMVLFYIAYMFFVLT
jgi:cation:H+ antiporter